MMKILQTIQLVLNLPNLVQEDSLGAFTNRKVFVFKSSESDLYPMSSVR